MSPAGDTLRVACGKGGRARTVYLSATLAGELAAARSAHGPAPGYVVTRADGARRTAAAPVRGERDAETTADRRGGAGPDGTNVRRGYRCRDLRQHPE